MDIEVAKKLIKKNVKLGLYKDYNKLEFIAYVSSKLKIINETNKTDTILYETYKKTKKYKKYIYNK